MLSFLERTLIKFAITLEVKWKNCSALHIVGVSIFFDLSLIFLMLALFYNSRANIRRRYEGTYSRYVYLSYFLLTEWHLEYSNREPWGCGAQDLSLSWLKKALTLHECVQLWLLISMFYVFFSTFLLETNCLRSPIYTCDAFVFALPENANFATMLFIQIVPWLQCIQK